MKPFTRLLVTAGLLLLAPVALAAPDKVSSYALDIEFNPGQSSMQGRAAITFAAPLAKGSKVFYLHGELDVESVSLNGQELAFASEPVLYDSSYALVADKVSFELDEDVTDAELLVTYGGYFHPSAARSPSDYMRIGEDGVYLRAWGYSLWFPVFLADDGDVYKLDLVTGSFKVPAPYRLVFVGEKTAEECTAEYTISEWRADDIELWDLQVTAREFQQLKSGNLTIYHLDSDQSRQAAESITGFTSQLLAYYSDHYRQNPGLENLNLLEMPEYGDISSHNMVGISSETFRSFDNAVYAKRTIAHELVHPFVSVQTNRSDPLWSLAIEGFPSYFHLPALRQIFGDNFYDEFMLKVEGYYLDNKGLEKDRWDNTRPPEVPLLQITADTMSDYKDDYILWGRSKLFFNYLLREMGEDTFAVFARDLFGSNGLTEKTFVALCRKHLPHKAAQINTWLYSNDFPDEFRIAAKTPSPAD